LSSQHIQSKPNPEKKERNLEGKTEILKGVKLVKWNNAADAIMHLKADTGAATGPAL
jgi:hypothetical protein